MDGLKNEGGVKLHDNKTRQKIVASEAASGLAPTCFCGEPFGVWSVFRRDSSGDGFLNAKKVKYSAATQKPCGRQAPVNKFELISAVDVTSHIRWNKYGSLQ